MTDDLRRSLNRNLSLLAISLVGVSVFPITNTVVVVFGIVPIDSDPTAFGFIFAGLGPLLIAAATAIWRRHIWPVYVVLDISYPLAVVLCVWFEPNASLLFCGVPILSGHCVLVRVYQLQHMGEPLFD
jgi:hypothetical protein